MKRNSKYVPAAPKYLIDLYENGEIENRKIILSKLLIGTAEMKKVWQELSEKITSDKDWNEIFQIICLAKLKSKKIKRYVTSKEIQAKYERLSKKLKSLSVEVEKDSNFDVPAYEFMNNQTLSIYGLADMESLDTAAKSEKAYKDIGYWPTTSELLDDMSKKASKLALDSISTSRSSYRNNEHLQEREFILNLGNAFKKMFNEFMYGTVATITHTLFSGKKDNTDNGIDKNFVISVLKPKGGV